MTTYLTPTSAALLIATLSLAPAAQAQVQPPPSGKPSDEQVRKDIWRDGAGKLEAHVTAGKPGELEWDPKTRTWTYQRGFIVTREGKLPDFPDAKLEVGGLAIYRHTGSGWVFQKELTTFNRYTGIPTPSDEQLIQLARSGDPERVFRGKLRDMPSGLGGLKLSPQYPVRWHNAKSLSFWLEASYDYRVPSNGRVTPCKSLWEVRIYRDNPGAAWRDASGSYVKILEGCLA